MASSVSEILLLFVCRQKRPNWSFRTWTIICLVHGVKKQQKSTDALFNEVYISTKFSPSSHEDDKYTQSCGLQYAMEYGHVHLTHITLINLKNKTTNNHSSHTYTEVSIFLIKKNKILHLPFLLLLMPSSSCCCLQYLWAGRVTSYTEKIMTSLSRDP